MNVFSNPRFQTQPALDGVSGEKRYHWGFLRCRWRWHWRRCGVALPRAAAALGAGAAENRSPQDDGRPSCHRTRVSSSAATLEGFVHGSMVTVMLPSQKITE